MPTKIQRFRYDNDSWNELGEVAPDGNRSGILAQLADWYLGKPGARLPERPHVKGYIRPTKKEAAKKAALHQFSEWYDRVPGVDLPDRPPKT